MNAALEVWARADQPEPLKARIAAVAATDAEMQAAYAEWMEPRVKSADEVRSEEELAEVTRTNDSARAEQEQSTAFVGPRRWNDSFFACRVTPSGSSAVVHGIGERPLSFSDGL